MVYNSQNNKSFEDRERCWLNNFNLVFGQVPKCWSSKFRVEIRFTVRYYNLFGLYAI